MSLTSGIRRPLHIDIDEEADAVPRDDGGVHRVKELLAPRLLPGPAAIVRVALEIPCNKMVKAVNGDAPGPGATQCGDTHFLTR